MMHREEANASWRKATLKDATHRVKTAEFERDGALARLAAEREKQAAAEDAARAALRDAMASAQAQFEKASASADRMASRDMNKAKVREDHISRQLEEVAAQLARAQLQLENSSDRQRLEAMRSEVLPAWMGARALPTRSFSGDTSKPSAVEQHRKQAVAHMTAVLRGRGEGESIEHVAAALATAGPDYPKKLMGTAQFAKVVKENATAVVNKVQEHWTDLLAVHIWDRLDLSRSQFETLRHLLSFVYDPETDKYVPIKAWINPNDPTDFVLSAQLASRWRREGKYNELVQAQNIEVGPNGRCQRDVVEAIASIYRNNAAALRSDYSSHRPAQPILFLDGTGSGLGTGLGHAEIGCADFVAGVKQSRSTLAPVAAWAGGDHRPDQEENLDVVMPAFNKAIATECIECDDQAPIPSRPITVADMQGTKATYGMSLSTHSVWCPCGKDEQHKYPEHDVADYEEMMAYIKGIGCRFKTEKEMCAWAHYSYGVHRGKRFTPFECSCCGYKPTESEWRADLAEFQSLDDEEQALRRRAHVALGSHHHQELFCPPLPHLGMNRAGVDNLHLTYLNCFKHLFKGTVHEGLPDSNKKAVAAYIKAAHFYSYNACSEEEDPCKTWIGREVKRFIEEAATHLPPLLRLAHAPADVVEGLEDCINGESGFSHPPFVHPPSPSLFPLQVLVSKRLTLIQSVRWIPLTRLRRPQGMHRRCSSTLPTGTTFSGTWTPSKRRGRRVPLTQMSTASSAQCSILTWVCPPFQPCPTSLVRSCALDFRSCAAAAQVCRDWIALKPTAQSWVPHIMLFIVSQQFLELGNPTNRSADACESLGARLKKIIKHLTCRRRCTTDAQGAPVEHIHKATREGKKLRWTQTLTTGYIKQAFSRACVSVANLYGPENAPFMQRADARLLASGRFKKARDEEKPPPPRNIRARMDVDDPPPE